MTTRKITAKDGADAIAMLDSEKKARAPKKAPVKVTKAQRVRDEFAKGASLTEAAETTGADPAYVWDLAKIWEGKTGTRVPRNGRAPKVVAEAPVATPKAPRTRRTALTEDKLSLRPVTDEKAEDAS